MSASLVGSEMCIRDSPNSRALVGGLAGRWGSAVPPRPAAESRARRLAACLLYTSDAADDM
eukprot:4003552-Alexandrium_andersonii.AAC.1